MADGTNATADQTSTPSFDWKAFSRKTWVIVIGGILFPPVGMILTWLKPGWSTRTKWIATGVLGLLLIGRNQPTKDVSGQEEPASVSAEAIKPDSSVEVAEATSSRHSEQEMLVVKKTAEPLPEDAALVEKPIQPMPDLTTRVKRNWLESQQAYVERIFNRTVIAVLEHHYGISCTPGAWTPTEAKQAYGTPTEYQSIVTRADGNKVHVRLRDKDYQFVWAAYEGGISPQNTIGYWLRDGSAISDHDFAIFKGDVAKIAKGKPPVNANAKSHGAIATSADDRTDPAYQEGYRYARGVLEAAKRAPPSAKRQVMQPLVDLAAEAERGSGSKPRLFYKGVAKAMSELMDNAMN